MFKIELTVHHPGKPDTPAEFASEYRKLYQAGVDLFAESNVCDIHDSTCWYGREDDNGKHFCCSGCNYLTVTGCIAESIRCKLWTCPEIVSRCKEFPNFTERLNKIIAASNALCARSLGFRKDLSEYIKLFYGKEEYEEWKITETLSSNVS